MYTKIVAHNKKEETLKAAAEMKKQEELKRKKKKETRSTEAKTKEQEEQMKQAQAAEKPAEGPPQEINENAQLDQYLQNAGFSGTAVIVKNGKVLLNKGTVWQIKSSKYRIIQRRLFILVLFQRRL